jgi:hypothetical protein
MALAWVSSHALAQSQPACPVIAMPAANGMGHFELRQCAGGHVIVTAFSPDPSAPSLAVDTGDANSRVLAQVRNLLVVQTLAHVYVFSFKCRRPALVLRTAARGPVEVHQADDLLVVSVSPRHYTFTVE